MTCLLWKFGKLLPRIQSCENTSFWGRKWTNCLKAFFFQEIIMIFMPLFFPFLCKIFKKSLARIQSYDCMSFSAQNGPIAINQFFLWKKFQCNFDVPISLFDRAKFSKNLKSRWVMAMHHFEPMAYFPWIFLEKTI